jgi:hypothetical protein
MDFKKILNNKVQASINLIHIQEELVGEYSNITKRLKKKIKYVNFDISLLFWS